MAGQEVSALLDEGAPMPEGATHVQFVEGGVNVYENDWRVEPDTQAEAAA